jgi:hypothetical protein
VAVLLLLMTAVSAAAVALLFLLLMHWPALFCWLCLAWVYGQA